MTDVLVVDDDVAVAELMRVVLEEADFRVNVASRATEMPNVRFACIVTDLVGVDAYSYEEARDWILRVSDRYPRTPVVVVTAHPDARADAGRLGVRVLMKPFDVEDLVRIVRDASG